MNFRKKFGGIIITKVSAPATPEWLGSWRHQQKPPEKPMYERVLPVCLRETRNDPLTERKDLTRADSPLHSYAETLIREAPSDDNEAQETGSKSRGDRSGTPSRKRRERAGTDPKPVRRKR